MCMGKLGVLKFIVLLALGGLITACSGNRYITSNQLYEKIHNHEPVLVIDTRTGFEYARGHIQGAIHLPFWKAAFIDEGQLACAGKTVVVHCAHGPRAGVAKWFLEGDRCPEIYYLWGHVQSWKKAGLPLVKGE